MSLALSAPDGVRCLCERVYGGTTMLSGLTSPQTLYHSISTCTAIPLRTLGYYELFLLVVMT